MSENNDRVTRRQYGRIHYEGRPRDGLPKGPRFDNHRDAKSGSMSSWHPRKKR